MKTEQIEFHFEDGELVAPVSHLYKKFIFSMMDKAVRFDDSPLLHEYFTAIMKDALKIDDLFKKAPKYFQEEVHQLLEIPYEEMYEMVRDKPYPRKEEEHKKPELKLVK